MTGLPTTLDGSIVSSTNDHDAMASSVDSAIAWDTVESVPPEVSDVVEEVFDLDFPPLNVNEIANPPDTVFGTGEIAPPIANNYVSHTSGSSVRKRRQMLREHNEERFNMGLEVLEVLSSTTPPDCKQFVSRVTASYRRRAKDNGVERALSYLKNISNSSRSSWILRNGSDLQAQTSFIGRALPVGNKTAELNASLSHTSTLRSEFQTDLGILDEMRSWSKRWARRYMGSPDVMPSPDLPTLSSCSESTVREGGLRGFAIGLGIHPSATALYPLILEHVPPQDADLVICDLSLLFHSRDLLAPDVNVPASEVIPLPERGLKVRVITKSPAGLHFAGHVVRKYLLAGLRRDPASQSTLIGFDDEEVGPYFKGAKAETIVSTDLSKASDLLPLDLVSALVDGLAASGKIPGWGINVLRLLSGSQRIDPSRSGGGEPYDSTRGILMGLPTTWALLSLIHLFWWDRSIIRVARRRNVKLRTAFLQNRFMICGDDGLFVGWREVADEYDLMVSSCGGEKSSGKHFRTGKSCPRAVFLERLFTFDCEGDLVDGAYRNRAIPLRGLVRPSVPDLLRGHGSRLRISKDLKLLLSVDSTWESHPGGIQGLLGFLRGPGKHLRAFSRTLGLRDGLPIKDGGSGLPIRQEIGLSLKRFRYRVWLARLDNSKPEVLLRGLIDPTYQLACRNAREDYDRFIDDLMFIVAQEGSEPPEPFMGHPYVRAGTVQEVIENMSLDVYSSLVWVMPISSRVPHLSQGSLGRSIRRWQKNLPVLPPNVDLDLPPESFTEEVWMLCTHGPNGQLLLPRGVGDTLASEARLRGQLAGEIGFPIAQLHVDP